MKRVNNGLMEGHVWHITQRCHESQFLLTSEADRRRWLYWLYQARKRFGLCILNYIVTSNHVHLLVHDKGGNSISDAMRFIADRTTQEFNKRQGRKGVFWEDGYTSTAIQTNNHLKRCMVYIDLNMVRANEVSHPVEWACSGYQETMYPRRRGARIDMGCICRLLDFKSLSEMRKSRDSWVTDKLMNRALLRESLWTDNDAVGDLKFAFMMKRALGFCRPNCRVFVEKAGSYSVREPGTCAA